MLPFGLRSSAKIFTALADALEWIVCQRGVPHITHYLDDFVVVGAPHSSQYADSLQILTFVCKELGIPLATGKCEGPTSCLTFLSITSVVPAITNVYHLFSSEFKECTLVKPHA